MTKNEQQSPNLIKPVDIYKNFFGICEMTPEYVL